MTVAGRIFLRLGFSMTCSAVIQAAERENDPELRAAASIMEQLKGKVKQR